jgi:hypothetical protein
MRAKCLRTFGWKEKFTEGSIYDCIINSQNKKHYTLILVDNHNDIYETFDFSDFEIVEENAKLQSV